MSPVSPTPNGADTTTEPVGFYCDHSDEPVGARTHHDWEFVDGEGFVFTHQPQTIISHGGTQDYLKPEQREQRCARAVPVYAVDVPALLAEVDRLRGESETRRRRMVAAEGDLLDIRGALAPADGPRRVPMELGERVAPVVEWLLGEVAELKKAAEAEAAFIARLEESDARWGERAMTAEFDLAKAQEQIARLAPPKPKPGDRVVVDIGEPYELTGCDDDPLSGLAGVLESVDEQPEQDPAIALPYTVRLDDGRTQWVHKVSAEGGESR